MPLTGTRERTSGPLTWLVCSRWPLAQQAASIAVRGLRACAVAHCRRLSLRAAGIRLRGPDTFRRRTFRAPPQIGAPSRLCARALIALAGSTVSISSDAAWRARPFSPTSYTHSKIAIWAKLGAPHNSIVSQLCASAGWPHDPSIGLTRESPRPRRIKILFRASFAIEAVRYRTRTNHLKTASIR
jgi:hypothetical protein